MSELGDRAEGSRALLQHPARRRPLRPLRRPPSRHAPALGGRVAPARRDAVAVRAVAPAPGAHRPSRAPPSAWSTPVARCEEEPELLDLPTRLSLFGLTRLPASYLDVLDAVACSTGRAPVPAAPVSGAVGASEHLRSARRRGTSSARDDPTAARAAQPAARVVGARRPGDAARARRRGAARRASARPGRARTVHGLCCSGSRTTSGPTAHRWACRAAAWTSAPARVRTTTASASTPATAGAARSRCCATPSCTCSRTTRLSSPATSSSCALTSRHFAPLIQATFGGARRRRRSAADASSRSAWPTARCARPTRSWASWRRCSSSRRRAFTATEVLDLAGREPVRRRFRFGDDDLSRLEEWVDEACVRWGFDAAHRQAVRSGQHRGQHLAVRPRPDPARRGHGRGAPAPVRRARSRWTTSTAATSSWRVVWPSSWSGFAPRSTRSRAARTIDAWARHLGRDRRLADGDVAARRLAAGGAHGAPRRARRGGDGESTASAPSPSAATTSARSWPIASRAGRRRANFCTGHLTVCTLVPMRSIPHRVVCLLGLDDGSFPRHIERDGDDLTARHPRVGDRDARSEDRQLLLDALLAARRSPGHHLQRPRRAVQPAAPSGGAGR